VLISSPIALLVALRGITNERTRQLMWSSMQRSPKSLLNLVQLRSLDSEGSSDSSGMSSGRSESGREPLSRVMFCCGVEISHSCTSQVTRHTSHFTRHFTQAPFVLVSCGARCAASMRAIAFHLLCRWLGVSLVNVPANAAALKRKQTCHPTKNSGL
jgi:hypothetical protein